MREWFTHYDRAIILKIIIGNTVCRSWRILTLSLIRATSQNKSPIRLITWSHYNVVVLKSIIIMYCTWLTATRTRIESKIKSVWKKKRKKSNSNLLENNKQCVLSRYRCDPKLFWWKINVTSFYYTYSSTSWL